ncbi:uncharacterized protein [Hetaerina americana]|uniref:uncharacterized protein n=1 Tax=Hetaerina americana TaxID=62018 RepID=UPI003A7F5E69
MAKVVQLNLNHCAVAQDLLFQTLVEEKADIAIISEVYKDPNTANWVLDSKGTAAVWVSGRLHISNRAATHVSGFTWVEVSDMRIYSCYSPPSDDFEEFARLLENIGASARSSRLPVVIAGDFNAWATEWGSKKTNARGRALLELLQRLS